MTVDPKGRRDWIAIGLLFVLGVLVVFLVFTAGWWMGGKNAVCHAPTEDSVMVDCDYVEGGWYPK